MNTPRSTANIHAALEARDKILNEVGREQDKVKAMGLSIDLDDLERRKNSFLSTERRLDRSLTKRLESLQNQDKQANNFLERLKDDTGSIRRQELMKALQADQASFSQAILLVTSKQGDLNYIRNLSADHRDALGIIESGNIKELRDRIHTKETEINRLREEVMEKSKIANGLEKELRANLRTAQASERKDKATRKGLETQLATTKKELEASEEQAKKLRNETDAIRQNKNATERNYNIAKDTLNRTVLALRSQLESIGAFEQLFMTRCAKLEETHQSIIARLEGRVKNRDESIQGLSGQLDDARRRISGFEKEIAEKDGKISKLEEDLGAEAGRTLQLQTQLRERGDDIEAKDTRISALGKELEDKKREIRGKDEKIAGLTTNLEKVNREKQRLEDSLQEANEIDEKLTRDLDTARQQVDAVKGDLETAREGKRGVEQAAVAQELGLSRFFAMQSGDSEGTAYEDWVPFVRAVAESDNVTGTNLTDPRPWTLLSTWVEDAERQLDRPPIPAPTDMISIAGKLYARALGGRYDEERFDTLRLLLRHLAEDDSTPIRLVLSVIEKYLEVVAPGVAPPETDAQLFLVGLQQVVSLVERRWPSANTDHVRDQCRERLGNCPLLKLDELLRDADSEANLRGRSPSEECFFGEHDTCLVQLPDVSEWIFAIEFTNRSIRMIHNTRGKWSGDREFQVVAPESDQPIFFTVQNKQEWLWFIRHFKRKSLSN